MATSWTTSTSSTSSTTSTSSTSSASSRAGQVALVTGSAQGLGAAIAIRLAQEGAALVINDVQADLAHQLADDLRARGSIAVAAPADVADQGAVHAMVEQVESELGPVDVLVNNAAFLDMVSFEAMDDATWDRTMAVDFLGPVICTQAVLGAMVARRSGWIVNISSAWGLVGARGASAYCAAKGAVIGWTAALGERLAGSGVTVAAIAPGVMDTPQLAADARFAGVSLAEIQRRYGTQNLLGRVAQPEEIASVVSRLATPSGSYFQGQTVAVTGGRGE
jgi:NAD(P)-dependent dehydrogenase (short-subunit alcohol dehydrogenase family)